MLMHRYTSLVFMALFAIFAWDYWNDPHAQFQAGINCGFFLWATFTAMKDFATYYSRKRGG